MTLSLPIETDRLILRPYRETDYDDLLELLSSEEVCRYLLHGPKGPEEVRESLARRMDIPPLDTNGQDHTFAVELKETGQHLGEVVFFLINTEHRLGEIGFVFHPFAQGKGYAAEASTAVLRFGFETLGLYRMIGRLDATNTASAALLTRLGMRKEAHFVRNEKIKGEWTDEAVFAMLDDEWKAL